MSQENDDQVSAAAREIVSTRVIDAPRELIWQAWADPKQLTPVVGTQRL